ncbi:MAG: hypothetical protein ACE5EE_09735 [Fidelibacterota bacterium]
MHCIFTVFLSLTILSAAFERSPSSPLQMGMGFSALSVEDTPLAGVNHPASISRFTSKSTDLFYTDSYQLTNLNYSGIALVYPLSFVKIGAATTSFGSPLYRETSFSIIVARAVGTYLNIGLSLNYYELTIKRYGATSTTAISTSFSYALAENLKWSLLYRNLNSPRIGTSRELLPQVVSTGFLYTPVKQIVTTFEVENDLLFTPRFKFGIGWSPLTGLRFAAGFVTHPSQATAAIQILWKGQKISYAIANHPDLPVSQMVAVQFRLP